MLQLLILIYFILVSPADQSMSAEELKEMEDEQKRINEAIEFVELQIQDFHRKWKCTSSSKQTFDLKRLFEK
jgi:hypothetical protein